MKYIVLILILSYNLSLSAQKHDYVWHFGYQGTQNPAFVLDFNYPNDSVYIIDRNIEIGNDNTSFCDSSGNLLFYTNGISIQDSSHQTMLNGDSLTPGNFSNGNYAFSGYPLVEAVMFLPVPSKDSIVKLFHLGMIHGGATLGLSINKLYVSTINKNGNNGKGEVISKNQLLVQGSLTPQLEAVKHANGQDWWIIVPEVFSNNYIRFLLTPDSLYGPYYQPIGLTYSKFGSGQASFSPDGNKYARYTVYNDLDIMDFDRCTGLFSNHIHIPILDSADTGSGAGGGIAFSPNSRYLYVSSIMMVYQYDMWASDISTSKDTVAIYDGFYYITPLLATTFFLAQLAPNNKIYLCATSGIPYLHVIHSPDSAGQACNFEQHAIQFPADNPITLPNFPHYRMGALTTLCDTATAVQAIDEAPKIEIKVYPNPANQQFRVEWTEQEFDKGEFVLLDAQGKIIHQQNITKNILQVDVSTSNLPTGIYLCKIQLDDTLFTEKIIVAR